MQLLKDQTSNVTGDWYRPGKGTYTVAQQGVFDGASLQIQSGKPDQDDDATIVVMDDDPDLAIAEDSAPVSLTLGDEDYIRSVLSNAGASTIISLWVG